MTKLGVLHDTVIDTVKKSKILMAKAYSALQNIG
jgi:hypothetical protein